jgi:predicted phage terminase large subunit-like protein
MIGATAKLDKRALAAGIDALKRRITEEVKPFQDGPGEQAARIERGRRDLAYFGQTYFPHYCTHPLSRMHREICGLYEKIILNSTPQKTALAAPRGNAKSTWTSLILPIWCIVHKRKHFIAIFSNSHTQAADFLDFIKAELESNERLMHDFEGACGEGPMWKYGTAVTRNGIRLKAWGVRQKLLGSRHLQWRPDLCIYDDLEDPEELANPENRKKNEAWFFRKAANIGDIKYTDHLVVGTILHTDALLPKLISKYGGTTYRSVIRWSESPLWREWELIYAQDPDPEKADARSYFEQHQDDMLAGTEVLWPEGESYYELMCLRQDIGPSAFDAEKQNNPAESGWFVEEWLDKWAYDPADIAGKHLIVTAACDPSMGKDTGAPSAIVVLGRDTESGIIYVLEADIRRRHPSDIIADIIAYQRSLSCIAWRIEEVQFQEYLKDQLISESMRSGVPLPAYGVRPHKDKHMRIQSLQPHIMNGVIRLPRPMKAGRDNSMNLWHQLIHYPKAAYLDGPDALEMAFAGAWALGEGRMVTRHPRTAPGMFHGYE